jgi:hypothetical protein
VREIRWILSRALLVSANGGDTSNTGAVCAYAIPTVAVAVKATRIIENQPNPIWLPPIQ